MLYYLFLFPLSIDFKGEDGGTSIIQILLTLTCLIFGIITYIKNKNKYTNRIYDINKMLIIVFLISSVLVMFFMNVEFNRYIRIIMPYILYYIGFIVGGTICNERNFSKIIDITIIASFISIIFTFIYGLISSGVSISEIRYQILSTNIYILIPIIFYDVFILERNKINNLFYLLMIFLLLLLSSTRSWILAFIILFLCAFYIGSIVNKKPFFNKISRLIIIFLIPFIIIVYFFPETIERIIGRVLSYEDNGFDMTSATRLAEIDSQWNLWLSSIATIIFGNGFGATYTFSGSSHDQLYALFGNQLNLTDVNWWFPGHNLWIYSLFCGGIIFGLIIPYLLISMLYKSAVNSFKFPHKKYNIFFFLIFLSVILSTIGGNAFGSRGFSLYIGLFMGIYSINYYKYSTK